MRSTKYAFILKLQRNKNTTQTEVGVVQAHSKPSSRKDSVTSV